MPATLSRVSKKPGRCGGEACMRDTRITVRGLVEWRRLWKPDAWLLANFPALNQADRSAAWEYAAAHQEEIDEAIQRNAKA